MVDETSRLEVEVDGTGAASDISRISAAFTKLEATVNRTSAAFSRLGQNTSSVFRRMQSGASRAFRAMGAGFRGLQRVARTFMGVFRGLLKLILTAGATFTLFARSVTTTGNQINKFINTLVILKGNVTDAVTELKFLFEIANRLGTSFTAAATPFTKFAAAAAGTLNDQAIRDVFESFATVGVALQLTQSEVTGVFLALQQIASKGVVSMEELRLQLAERVPGAMRLAASAMGMTMSDFEQAVRDRTINAGEFLEKFAAKLKETFGIAAELASERLFADIQRLGNAFTAFRQDVFQSGFEEGLKNLVRAATGFLQNNPELADALGQFSKSIFDNVANFLNSLSADRVVGILNQLIGAFEGLVNAIQSMVFHIRKAFDDDFSSILSKVDTDTQELARSIELRNVVLRNVQTQTIEQTGLFGSSGRKALNTEELALQQKQLDNLNERIAIMRDLLIQSRQQARDLGVEFGELPTTLFQGFDPDEAGPIPGTFTVPRIEPVASGGEQGLQLGNQPVGIPSIPPAIFDALDQADALSNIKMPIFFDKLISGEIRNGMDELARLTLDLNILLESQELALQAINERQIEINRIRSLPDEQVNAAELNRLIREQTEATEAFLAAEEQKFELLKKQNDELERRDRILEKSKSFQKSLEETFTSVQDVVFDSIKKTEDAIVDLVTTGKANFSDLANAIIRDLVRMAVQAFITRFILGPLLGGATQAVGDQLGGTLSTPQGIPPNAFAHTGGVVGEDRLEQRGGFERLRTNEQPIIAQRGEGIFTQRQMRALAPLSELGAIARRDVVSPVVNVRPVINVPPSSTKVEIINNTEAEATVETTTQADGSELIKVIVGAVGQNIAGDGELARIMKGKFGLKNQTGLR